jgi:predicted RNA-binding Zn-ribbon protein involved in translation (DUF1610 family)
MDVNLKTGEMGFDSSLFDTLDSQLTQAEFKDHLIELVRPILQQRFTNEFPKQQVLAKHGRVNFACPYCGDSMKNSYAKRANFILDGKHKGFFKCHNCGEFKRIDHFFTDFKVQLRLDAVNYLTENLGNFSTQSNTKYDMSILLDMDSIDKYAIDRHEFLKYFGLVEVKGSPVWPWLTNRVQYQQDKFLYNRDKNYLLMLNLTRTGKILGAQKRMFKGANRFETYKLSKLYEHMNRTLKVTPEELDYLDTLSMVFNICLISFEKSVTLFEGPMDSFLFKNSIANTGANKTLPVDIQVRYWYDDDKTGRQRALQHITQSEQVFLWDRFKKDFNLPYRTKWDLNDVLVYLKSIDSKENLFFDKYFSGDPLDLIDI